jgi:hypothetical protein
VKEVDFGFVIDALLVELPVFCILQLSLPLRQTAVICHHV